MAKKAQKLPSKLLDNLPSCHAAVLKLHKLLLFSLLIENVESCDTLLLHCWGGGGGGRGLALLNWPLGLYSL